jgi:hypothetical protein
MREPPNNSRACRPSSPLHSGEVRANGSKLRTCFLRLTRPAMWRTNSAASYGHVIAIGIAGFFQATVKCAQPVRDSWDTPATPASIQETVTKRFGFGG